MPRSEAEEGIEYGGRGLQQGGRAFSTAATTMEDFLADDAATGAEVAWDRAARGYDVGQEMLTDFVYNIGIVVSGFNFDFVKFDIVRDFLQIMGLFFVGIQLPDSFKTFWGNVYRFFSLTLPDLVDVDSTVVHNVWFWLLFVTSLALFSSILKARVSTDDIREGLEARHWIDQGACRRNTTKVTLTLLTTLYLPVSEVSIRILVCDRDWRVVFDNGECYRSTHFAFIVVCVMQLVVISFGLPYFCYRVIQENKPHEKYYDAEGLPIPDNRRKDTYFQDLKRDPTPYKFLYNGYEFRWAHYKVFIMMIKFCLVLPVIILSRNNAIFGSEDQTLAVLQVAIVILVLFVYMVLAFMVSPFLLRENDLLDRCGRIASFATAIISLFIALEVWNDDDWGLVLNILHAINVLVMLSLFFTGIEIFGRCWRKMVNKLQLTPSHTDDGKPLFFSHELNLLQERKRRVWHEFWDGLFMTHPDFAPPEDKKWAFAQASNARNRAKIDSRHLSKAEKRALYEAKKDTAPYLQHFEGTVGERHEENKRIAQVVGFEHYAEHCQAESKRVARMKKDIIDHLVGIDVYYEGVPEDGELSSLTCFGRVYVIPFPFTVTVLYDDDDDHAFLRNPQQWREFLSQNRNQEIMRRRYLRTRLRALDQQRVYFYHKAEIQKTKTRGSGKQKSTYKLWVEFTFRYGIVHIGGYRRRNLHDVGDSSVINVSEGFKFSLMLVDGEGIDEEGKRWTGESLRIGDEVFGMNKRNEFEETRHVTRLLNHPDNMRIWKKRHKVLMRAFRSYRRKWKREFKRKQRTLSYAFHYHVYNNFLLNREGLEHYLRNYEHNKKLRKLPDTHSDGLDMLYSRLEFVDAHPGNAAWFVFWHDVWKNNSDYDDFEEAERWFNPSYTSSICYKPMDQDDLEEYLHEHGVWSFFSRRLLHRLYNRLDEILSFDDEYAVAAPEHFYTSPLVDGTGVHKEKAFAVARVEIDDDDDDESSSSDSDEDTDTDDTDDYDSDDSSEDEDYDEDYDDYAYGTTDYGYGSDEYQDEDDDESDDESGDDDYDDYDDDYTQVTAF